MASRAGVFLILLLMAKPVEPEAAKHFIVWNVGQGLWTTLVDGACWHFDMGGEFAPWPKIMALCRPKKNYVHLSHWDSDHINFVGRAKYWLPNICRAELPAGTPKAKKLAMVKRLKECGFEMPFAQWRPEGARTSNDASSVIAWNGVLVPGDSSKSAEELWVEELPEILRTHLLLLGHHGSRTSTSARLLNRLPQLRMSVASARNKRYGHPHAETENMLKRFETPILRTEDWGNIYFWL